VDILTLVLFLLGLGALIVGAEFLVRGASRLAAAMGVSPLVIGLTVVAYGTSSPEMAVSVLAALSGQADITLGNVVGSNIFNVLFILGLSALLVPLVVSRQLVWLEVPLMVGVSLLLLLLAADGTLSRFDGFVLFTGAVAYTLFAIYQSRKEGGGGEKEYAQEISENGLKAGGSLLTQIVSVVAGLALLVLGSRWLVNGAVAFAQSMGVSDFIIGLTIVAAGTSLPEIATSLLASLRGERDIAVGNVVGSNIFNILVVLGLSSVLAADGIPVPPAALRFDIPVMIAVAVACLPIFFTGHLIARWEGVLFFAYYVAYTAYLILDAAQHDMLSFFSWVMMAFVVPLTLVTLMVGAVRSLRGLRSESTRAAER